MKKKLLLTALAAYFFCCGFSYRDTETGYINKDIKMHGIAWEQYLELYVIGRNDEVASVYYMGEIYDLPAENIVSYKEIQPDLASSGKTVRETMVYLTTKKETEVYFQPGADQGVIGTLREGQNAIAIEKPANGWIQIYYIGKIGYIREDAAEFYMTPQLPNQNIISPENGIRINVLGDSISYGDGLKDRSKAYPYIFSTKADASCLNNYSICGTCITGSVPCRFLDRYPEMDRDADLILVFGGTNDYGVLKGTDLGNFGDITDETFYGSLNLMMCGLKQMYPDGRIVFMTPLRRAGDKNRNAKGYSLSQYASAIQEMGAFWGIEVIDTFHTSKLDFRTKTSYLPDGLHPSKKGHELLGNFLYEELLK